jgi:hypothetical protein
MWLILCHADDFPALWLHEALLADDGGDSLELVTAETLASSIGWEHRVGTRKASTTIRLADGRIIRSNDVRGVVNRIRLAPLPIWRFVEARDREYVQQELNAFYLSWLHALPGPVLNPATPNGMCGAWRHNAIWTRIALQAGLRVTQKSPGDTFSMTPAQSAPSWSESTTVIVVGDTTTNSAAPKDVVSGCKRLSAIADTPLVGVTFEIMPPGEWVFRAATPFPDFRLGGTEFLMGLRKALGLTKGDA